MNASTIVATMFLHMASPTADASEVISDTVHSVFVETACMTYFGTDTPAADIDPASYPEKMRPSIVNAVELGRSVDPSRDQCVKLWYPIVRKNGWK